MLSSCSDEQMTSYCTADQANNLEPGVLLTEQTQKLTNLEAGTDALATEPLEPRQRSTTMHYTSHVHTHNSSSCSSCIQRAGSEIKAYLTLTLEWTGLEP